jgi:hypothetical protein
VSELEQERGNATHPAAGHADKMNAVMLTREKSRQTELSRTRFSCGSGRIFLHRFHHRSGGVSRRKFGRVLRHPLQAPMIFDEGTNFLCERVV